MEAITDSEKILLFVLTAISLILPCHMGTSDNPIKLDSDPVWYNPCLLEEVSRENPALEVDRQQELELYMKILEKVQDAIILVENFKDKMSNEVFKENYNIHIEKAKKQYWMTWEDINLYGEIPDLSLIPSTIQEGEIPNLNEHRRLILLQLRSMLQKIAISTEVNTYMKYAIDDPYANTFYSMFKKLNQILCEIERAMVSLHIEKEPNKKRRITPEFKPEEDKDIQNEDAVITIELYLRGMNYTHQIIEHLRKVAHYYAQSKKE